MRHKKTKQMLDYWMDLYNEIGNTPDNHHKHIWPDRSDVQPAQCRSLLGDMFILDSTSSSVSYRLAGTKLCSLYGRELKQERFADAFVSEDQQAAENWASQLARDDYLALICSKATTEDGHQLNLETLLMPLSHNGGVGARILGITIPCESPPWLGSKHIVSQAIRSVRVLHPWDKEVRPGQEVDVISKVSTFPSFNLGSEAPSILTSNDPFLSSNEIMGGYTPSRRVGHLTVIDGGKSET
ncbi:MAG: PAS domain-containing protein [Rhizobiaceae bacterium]